MQHIFNYNKDESDALDEKMEHPERKVICPRCGKELIFTDYGCGCVVECQTKECLYAGIRGI